MTDLYLNSYPLTFSGEVSLFQMRDAAVAQTRQELRQLTGVHVFVEDAHAYAYSEPAGVDVEPISEPLIPVDNLRLWAVRGALIDHCHGLGMEAWFGFGGELHVIGATPAVIEDRFRVEHVLVLRVSREEYVDAHALLTARHRTRWRSAEPISDPDVRARAVDQTALRLRGVGPGRGRVLRADADRLVLVVGEEEFEATPEDYAIAVNASLVAGWRGSAALRQLRVTTGELTVNGKRNRHGIADRFKLVGDAVRRLGTTVAVNGGGKVVIDRAPIAIRLEDSG